MSTLQIDQSLSTNLKSGWEPIYRIDIPEQPFNEGAFGEVFECVALNDQVPFPSLVIKLFKYDPDGNHRRGYETIRKLQTRIREKQQNGSSGQKSLIEVPALYALPQFSFKGQWKGQEVFGYGAYQLSHQEFKSLDDILQHQFRDFRRIAWRHKVYLALHLTECFEQLRGLNYIHADINPHNLFIKIPTFPHSLFQKKSDRCLVLIDYDSGVVVDQPSDIPTTFGKQNEWLAPEVYEQQAQAHNAPTSVNVDLFTDTWAVAVGVHYLLFSRFPFFFLKVAGPGELRDYLQNYRWPEIDKNYHNFNPSQIHVYTDYKKRFDRMEIALKRPFLLTFNEGIINRTRRASYSQWVLVLKKHLARQTLIRNSGVALIILTTLFSPWIITKHTTHNNLHHSAESDAEHAQAYLNTARQFLVKGDLIKAEKALASADLWDPARVAQFRRDQAAIKKQNTNSDQKLQSPLLTQALSLVRHWEEKHAFRKTPFSSPPRPGDLWQDDITDMEFVYLKEGCFTMGSHMNEIGHARDELYRHTVCFEKGFWLGVKEVTNAQYQHVYPNHKSGEYQGQSLNGDTQPVVKVSWWDANNFISLINQQARSRGLPQQYQLPNDAQWEYAARAGTTTRYFWGNDSNLVCSYANVTHSEGKKTQKEKTISHTCRHQYAVSAPVGSFLPNPWGLYDMLGNVWEWTCSSYHLGQEHTCAVETDNTPRIVRGYSWRDPVIKISNRDKHHPDFSSQQGGFRVLAYF